LAKGNEGVNARIEGQQVAQENEWKGRETMTGLVMKYFVLKPEGNDAYAAASRAAMFRYATMIRAENNELASELEEWASHENAKTHVANSEKADNAR